MPIWRMTELWARFTAPEESKPLPSTKKAASRTALIRYFR